MSARLPLTLPQIVVSFVCKIFLRVLTRIVVSIMGWIGREKEKVKGAKKGDVAWGVEDKDTR